MNNDKRNPIKDLSYKLFKTGLEKHRLNRYKHNIRQFAVMNVTVTAYIFTRWNYILPVGTTYAVPL